MWKYRQATRALKQIAQRVGMDRSRQSHNNIDRLFKDRKRGEQRSTTKGLSSSFSSSPAVPFDLFFTRTASG